MENNNKILHLEDIRKEYNGKCVLDDIDLSVTKGEFCTVVGPSGHGKSTILRIVLGQELPTSGKIEIEGKEAGFADVNRGIVYQKYSLFPHLSVIDNILLGKKLTSKNIFEWRKNKNKHIEEAMFYLEKVKMKEHYKKYPHELSGGMQQRVAILQSIIMKPKILLMDEPFSALDPGTREDIQLYLLELWKETGMTIFFVTHDLEEAVFLGTRIVTISKFYTDARGDDFERGARIVTDLNLKEYKSEKTQRTDIKYTDKFRSLIQDIRKQGFDPTYMQHVKEFNLKHPDSYQTLTKDVSGE